MTMIMPTAAQITSIVTPLLKGSSGEAIGVAVGVASPDFAAPGFFFNGSVVARSGAALTLDEDTLFAIGSVSKTYTATLFAAAVQNDSSIAQSLLGGYAIQGTSVGSNFKDIPLLTLANYTSGLPADNSNGPIEVPPNLTGRYTVEEMFEFLATNPFGVSPPNRQYAYSNLGFALLGAVTPKAMGLPDWSWEPLLQSTILEPLGITLQQIQDVSPDLLPASFDKAGKRTGEIPKKYPAFNPGGGLVFSSADLMRWLAFNMGMGGGLDVPTFVPLLAMTQQPSTSITTPQGTNIGLGWFLSPDGVFKDGGVVGFSTLVAFMASNEPGIVPSTAGAMIMVNRSVPLDLVMSEIFEAMNGSSVAGIATPEIDAAT
jgi:D-alanyl-D-alanine-carboxypeptidase/D-alanyl-D-alanine-endopeptidase